MLIGHVGINAPTLYQHRYCLNPPFTPKEGKMQGRLFRSDAIHDAFELLLRKMRVRSGLAHHSVMVTGGEGMTQYIPPKPHIGREVASIRSVIPILIHIVDVLPREGRSTQKAYPRTANVRAEKEVPVARRPQSSVHDANKNETAKDKKGKKKHS